MGDGEELMTNSLQRIRQLRAILFVDCKNPLFIEGS